jgi:hypothetical protein
MYTFLSMYMYIYYGKTNGEFLQLRDLSSGNCVLMYMCVCIYKCMCMHMYTYSGEYLQLRDLALGNNL